MFRLLRTVLLFTSPFLFASRLSSQQTSPDYSCPCTLRGVVLDAVTGNPIHNVFVQASAGSAWSTLTDSEGKFQLDALPAGRITVHAAKPGFLSQDELGASSPKSFSLQVSPDAAPAILKLTPEAVIFGQVTDENGEPLENFLVSLINRNSMNLPVSPAYRQQVATDDEGKFRIASLRPGSYYVAVHPEQGPALTSAKTTAVPHGFIPVLYPAAADLDSATPIKVLPGKSVQVDFSLKREPFLRLSGTVSGYSPEQAVALSLHDSLGEQVRQEIAFDASTGAFHTKWIPPGHYTLSALTHPKGSPDSSPLSFARQFIHANSNLSAIRLVLQPTVTIPYVIHGLFSADSENQHSRRFSLWLSPKGPDSRGRPSYSNWFFGHTGTSFEPAPSALEGVEPGTYEVAVGVDPERVYYVESVSWGSTNLLHDPLILDSAGAVPPIEVFLREGAAAVSGTVFSNDQPVPAVVVLFSPDEKMKPDFVTAESDGTFMRMGLAPGTYRVIALENLGSLDLERQEALRALSSKAQEVTLVPGQTALVHLELTKVGE